MRHVSKHVGVTRTNSLYVCWLNVIEISSPFQEVSEIILSSVLLLRPHKVSISYSSCHSY